ncbi:TPA: TIGR03749 family integrating conjugative element protein [Pasteurella multocida]|nr:TIGR03749 family integrating conjugative element protein [Mannheimia haemolytica]HEH9753451.1 TIGR03749 family integrating conjugative element protein [Pasteurella multocida]HEH9757987.1 TIGR03749 family integrating conjugative element protein [Pasteurella multocida]HEH9760255.1 TIGR03749 family integrating conjugative element protein [Pasteurella multocida]HEH9762483.1 TIGR03749 family integrating conjugative element protein [Pasteurella multocida]
MKRLPILLVSLLIGFSGSSLADVLMKWERKPLPVALQVEKERIIFVDKNVKVGYPAELDGKLRIQSTGGAVYLKALETFPSTRIEFRDVTTGEIFLFDLTAASKVANPEEAIRVVFDGTVEKQSFSSNRDDESSDLPIANSRPQLPVPAALTRYAAQSLYAPLRAVEPLEGVRRVAHRLPKKITTLLPAYSIEATPLISWQLDEYVVTAIRLQNKGNTQITLDPRELQGQFYAATFQHNWLGGYGGNEDTTTLYLVTEGYANNALIPETRPVKPVSKKVKKTTKVETKPAQSAK